MCQNDIRAKRLVRVLTDWESPSLQVSATFLGRRKESRRLRAFLDFMEAKLRIEGDPLAAGQTRQPRQDNSGAKVEPVAKRPRNSGRYA
jgi:hypothetical protein